MTDEEAELRVEALALSARLKEIAARIQEICEHKWYWHQIAGEGQICSKCNARNYDVND